MRTPWIILHRVHRKPKRNSAADRLGVSDGVVTYDSTHLEGAVLVKIIRSNHNVHTSPAGILEVSRMLHEHIRSASNSEKVMKNETKR